MIIVLAEGDVQRLMEFSDYVPSPGNHPVATCRDWRYNGVK